MSTCSGMQWTWSTSLSLTWCKLGISDASSSESSNRLFTDWGILPAVEPLFTCDRCWMLCSCGCSFSGGYSFMYTYSAPTSSVIEMWSAVLEEVRVIRLTISNSPCDCIRKAVNFRLYRLCIHIVCHVVAMHIPVSNGFALCRCSKVVGIRHSSGSMEVWGSPTTV